MRRLISLLLVIILLVCNAVFPACAGSSSIVLRARLFTENFDTDSRHPADCLSDLLEIMTLTVTGSVSDDPGNYFSDTFSISLESGDPIEFSVYGSDSEWVIASPVLGEVKFLLELDALCEFAIKTYNHLGIPLQLAALLVPYVHRSGTAALISCLNDFLPDEDGTFTFTKEDMESVCHKLASIMQSDRSFTYWLMCIGIRSGFDSIILEEAEYLSDALPETLTVTVNKGIVTDVHSEDITYYHSEDGSMLLLIPETPVYGYTICALNDHEPFSLSVDISSEVSDENAFSLSVTDNGGLWRIDADGTALQSQIHFMLSTDDNGNIVISDPAGLPLAEITAESVDSAENGTPLFSGKIPDDAVNIFSLNDTTLASLSDKIILPVLQELVPFISRIPSSTCQCLMDWLSDSGLLTMLLTGTGSLDE